MARVVDEHLAANRRLWDERARAHYRSRFYDVAGFKRGAPRLHRTELRGMPFQERDDLTLYLLGPVLRQVRQRVRRSLHV